MKKLFAVTTANWHFIQLCIIASLLIFIVFQPNSIQAQYQTYKEDFTTTTYKDADNTTVLWDTEKGEITLAPFRPFKLGGYDTAGSSRQVAVSGNYAYVADYDGGLVVINITDPANPTFAGEYPVGQKKAYDLVVDGDWLYMVNGEGLVVINISDPSEPSLAGSVVTDGVAHGIAFAGEYAFVGDYDKGLVVICITDPANPSVVSTCDTEGYAHGIAVSGNYAFVADYHYGVVVVDIKDLTNPVIAGSFTNVGGGQALDVEVSGDYAFVANGQKGLEVLDIQNPNNPVLKGSYKSGYAHGIAISGDYAYIADTKDGLLTIDIKDPATPTMAGGYSSAGKCLGVTLAGNCAYVASGTSGLEVVQISCLVRPSLVSHIDWSTEETNSNAYKFAIRGDYFYIGDTFQGLQIIDITDPTNPIWIKNIPGYSYFIDIKIDGNYGYICTEDDFDIIDFTDPLNPIVIASMTREAFGGTLSSNPIASVIRGDYCYLRTENGLDVIDISDPYNPAVIGHLDEVIHGDYFYNTLEIKGDMAYLIGEYKLGIIDISNPEKPITAYLEMHNWMYPRDIAISGNYAYISSENGLKSYDISNAADFQYVGQYKIHLAMSLELEGDRIYGTGSMFWIFDISDPANPIFVDKYLEWAYNFYDPFLTDDYVYSFEHGSGLYILQVSNRSILTPSIAQSKPIQFEKQVLGAQLAVKEDDLIDWQLSAGDGDTWLDVDESMGCKFDELGDRIIWKATLHYGGPQYRTNCDMLEIQPLFEHPTIRDILIKSRVGKSQAAITFTRSAYDFDSDPSHQVSAYKIFKWINDVRLVEALRQSSRSMEPSRHIGSGLIFDQNSDKTYDIEWMALEYHGKQYLISGSGGGREIQFPLAVWELVGGVSANQSRQYKAEFQTEGWRSNSSRNRCYVVVPQIMNHSKLFVSPIVFGGPVDNIPPVYKELID